MFCANCGKEIPEDSNICPYCGAVVSSQPNYVETPPSQEGIQQQSQTPVEKTFSKSCIAGFVLSLVGLIIAALPCGIMSVYFCSVALKNFNPEINKSNGLAIAGLVIGIIDIVFGIVNIINGTAFLNY